MDNLQNCMMLCTLPCTLPLLALYGKKSEFIILSLGTHPP